MKLIINHSSMQPIYEQIVEQTKEKIMHGELTEETTLPSVRTLAKDLKVSALTVKKAYDALEQEGFVNTVHGKGFRHDLQYHQCVSGFRSDCGCQPE